MILDFFGIVFGMRIGEAVLRFYFAEKTDVGRRQVISTAVLVATSLSMFGLAIILGFSGTFSEVVLGGRQYESYLVPFAFTLVMDTIANIGMIYLMARQKPWFFISMSILRLCLQITFNIYFVVIRGMHVEGVIYSALIASFVIMTVMSVYVLSINGFLYSRPVTVEIVKFSLPMIAAGVAAFYSTFGDRYFLRVFSGLDEVGLYSLGYKFGFVLVMVSWDPFQKIWASLRYQIYEKENAVLIYQRIFTYISLAMIFVALGIALFVKDFFHIVAARDFWPAHKVVPVVLIAYIFQSWSSFCNLGILITKNTIQITYGMIVGVAVITAGYLMLIPAWGAMGAAVATLAGFVSSFYWIYRRSRRYYDMKLPWMKVAGIGGLAAAVYMLSLLLPEETVVSISARIGLVLLFVMGLLSLPILSEQEKSTLLGLLKGPHRIRQVFAK
jgi:O-antigen/teichoic acid export membrane protein